MKNKTKEQLIKEIDKLNKRIAGLETVDTERRKAEEELKAANQQLQASEQQLKASNQQLIASEQQLKASNQQLDASNQQLRASEQEIRKMEENWRESFNSLEDIMILIDRDFNIEKINANGLKLFGKSEKAVLGKKCYEIFHGENVPCEECSLKKSLETGKVESLERFEKDFGRYFSIKGSPIFDEKGNIVRFVDLLRDITDRKKAEETLIESEEKYRSLYESSKDGIVFGDLEGNLLDANQALLNMLGYTLEEFMQLNYADFTPEKWLEKDKKKIAEAVEKGYCEEYEKELVKKDGEMIDISLRIFLTEDDKSKKIWGLARDITERKKAEEKLILLKEHYEDLYYNAPIMYLSLDMNGKIIECNKIILEKLGYKKGELVDKYITNFITEGSINKFKKDFPKLQKNGKMLGEERQFISKSGEILTFILNVSIIYDEHGKPIKTRATFEDITERKMAENALRESQKRFQALTETTNDFVWEIDANGVYTYCSPQSYELWGYKSEDMIGRTPFDLMIPEGREHAIKMFRTISESQSSFKRLETSSYDNAGQIVVLETSGVPFFDIDGRLLGYRGISRDITERKKAEEALQKEVLRFRILMDASLDGIAIINQEHRVVEANQRFVEMLGYTYEEAINLHTWDWEAEMSEAEIRANFADLTRIKVVFETRHRRKDGTTYHVEVSASGAKVGDEPMVFTVSRDITERKQLEEERIKTEKLESIGILAGGIAHDFTNILAVILGNVSLAKISLDNKSEVVELLTETEKACVRATRLTQQLLTFAKGGAPVKETTELTELIRETTQFSLRGSNVQYHTSIPPDLWAADVDKGQISQVISNLVINAQQAMPEGGTINIKAENVTVTPEDILPLHEGIYIKISVVDKGIGISEEHLTKIFDPYFTTKQKGSGLGLATTYSIINRHDGHIAVESELGVGTTFHIYLPASSKQVEKKEAVKEESAIFKGKILLMDDELDIRKMISKTLIRGGNEVEAARDGEEAIKLYKKAMDSGKPFDVVILDLTIPGGMGGKKTIKKLLEIDSDAKAIVSSGYADDPVLSNFGEYGFKGCISKPYKPEELKKVLNEVLSERNK